MNALHTARDILTLQEVYVTLDIPLITGSRFEDSKDDKNNKSLSSKNLIQPSSLFQITDIDHETPLMKLSNNNLNSDANTTSMNNLAVVDGKIFQTKWLRLVGTDLIFDDYGEIVGSVREHLSCESHIKIKPKKEVSKEEENEDEAEDDDSKKETKKDTKKDDTRTAFFKKALRAAKKRNQEREFQQPSSGGL